LPESPLVTDYIYYVNNKLTNTIFKKEQYKILVIIMYTIFTNVAINFRLFKRYGLHLINKLFAWSVIYKFFLFYNYIKVLKYLNGSKVYNKYI